VRANAVVKDEVIGKPLSKEPKAMYHIKILSDKLFLDRSVVTLHAAVNLGATRITESMFDLH
jgi:hypothetical protein